MIQDVCFFRVMAGNALVALSALACLGACTSCDSSGLQYLLLVRAAWLAGEKRGPWSSRGRAGEGAARHRPNRTALMLQGIPDFSTSRLRSTSAFPVFS
jgi:hypothetical protein